MGRFTLRDEGKTIAIGKVLKYKPYVKGVVGASKEVQSKPGAQASTTGASTTINNAPEMVYDMETGEMKPKAKQLEALAEENEEEDD